MNVSLTIGAGVARVLALVVTLIGIAAADRLRRRPSFAMFAAVCCCLWALMLSGCGQVTLAPSTTPDAAAPADVTQTSDSGAELEHATGSIGETAPPLHDAGADVKSCAPWSTAAPPYCGSCRDGLGVCRCGALPCCDQHCQS